jgi:hypothetical protein
MTLITLNVEQKKRLGRIAQEGTSDPDDMKLIATAILRLFENIEQIAAQPQGAKARIEGPGPSRLPKDF